MPTLWIALFLSACTFGGAFAVVEMSGMFAALGKAAYAMTVLGLAAYLVMHDSEREDDFATPAGPHGTSPALDRRSQQA